MSLQLGISLGRGISLSKSVNHYEIGCCEPIRAKDELFLSTHKDVAGATGSSGCLNSTLSDTDMETIELQMQFVLPFSLQTCLDVI